jgi:DNA (cytosine-5)-methyltransferase 1
MRLLDLYCGAGGAAMGYHRAGFTEIVGIDLRPQPRYPFRFIQADALKAPIRFGDFDAIHASPPCQKYTTLRKGLWKDRDHVDLVDATRAQLVAAGVPYVIENVPGAPLVRPILLCGTMFALRAGHAELRRHRLFEIAGFEIDLIPPCAHGLHGRKQPATSRDGSDRYWPATVEVYGNPGGSSRRDHRQQYPHRVRSEAMGIAWMKGAELSEAIPPAYTEFLGRPLLAALAAARADKGALCLSRSSSG